MADNGAEFRQSSIDYSQFPDDAPYVSVHDVRAAYAQGNQEGYDSRSAEVAELVAQLQRQKEALAMRQAELNAELRKTGGLALSNGNTNVVTGTPTKVTRTSDPSWD